MTRYVFLHAQSAVRDTATKSVQVRRNLGLRFLIVLNLIR